MVLLLELDLGLYAVPVRGVSARTGSAEVAADGCVRRFALR
ncbi:hypothetical protein [Amycolatopsis sp. NBC_01286]|nr:hypothetical protein OG570_32290 [Amycolatopsis sp. NBC_01286]